VPVPRKFDRRPPERDLTRINERIRVPEVRLIGEDGSQIGVLPIEEALNYAQERDLDLVEVAPEARPPVCRVLDYSKYKYEQAQKQKQARKHQQQITIREIKFRPKIASHDYETKKGHIERFLRHRDKVKVTIMFRGREVTHPEQGTAILDRLAGELEELAVIEQRPIQDGRNMTMLLAPSRAVLAGQLDPPRDDTPGADDGAGGGRDGGRRRDSGGDSGAEAQTETQADSQANSQAQTETSPQPETEAPSQPETEASPQPETEASPQPETEASPQPETEAPSQPETEAASHPQTEAASHPQTEAASQPQTEVNPQPEAEETSDGTAVPARSAARARSS
jgi:translation initiation factor IF-3